MRFLSASDIYARAVFFDRDGVILKPVVADGKPRPPYNRVEYEEKSGLVEGAAAVVAAVKTAGFLAIMATNQPDLRYGNITREDFDWIQTKASALPFDDIFICYHGRNDGCACKKPKPGMLFAAAEKWNIDLTHSFVVGDTEIDVRAAKAVGCRSIILDAPYNQQLLSDVRIASLGELLGILRSARRE